MRPESFPCIKCGKILLREIDDYEGQPSDGIMCTSGGNYGSTVFDPMNGEKLAFNICDECIVEAGKKGRVMTYLSALPVSTDIPNGRGGSWQSVVGWMRVSRPYLPWNRELPPSEEKIYMPISEILERFDDDKFKWNLDRKNYEQIDKELEELD